MALSIDGYIAKENFSTDFVSKEEWTSFIDFVKKTGNLVTGRTTYESLVKRPELGFLDDIKLVVVSTKLLQTSSSNHTAVDSPQKALEILKRDGFNQSFTL